MDISLSISQFYTTNLTNRQQRPANLFYFHSYLRRPHQNPSKMPNPVAAPPSNEFNIRLIKPYSGTPEKTIEVIGEPNRPSTVSVVETKGGQPGKKVGDIQA